MSEFGERVLAARTALNLSQKELAERLGYEPQSVSNWECGRGRPWRRREMEILAKLDAMIEPKPRRPPVGDRL